MKKQDALQASELINTILQKKEIPAIAPKGFLSSELSYVSQPHTANNVFAGISYSGEDDYKVELRAYTDRAFKLCEVFVKESIRNQFLGARPQEFNLWRVVKNVLGFPSIRNNFTSPDFEPPHVLNDQRRPLLLGASIKSTADVFGSIGGFFIAQESYDAEKAFLLSCSHVLWGAGKNRAKPNDAVTQPPDGDLISDEVGHLYDGIKLEKSRLHIGDAALAMLKDDVQAAVNQVPSTDDDNDGHRTVARFLLDQGMPTEFQGRPIRLPNDDLMEQLLPSEPGSLEHRGPHVVHKIGARTGYTSGLLSGVNIRTKLVNDQHSYEFMNVWEVVDGDQTPFAYYGDSGSLAFVEIGRDLVALGPVFGAISASRGNDSRQKPRTVYCVSPILPLVKRFTEKLSDLEWA